MGCFALLIVPKGIETKIGEFDETLPYLLIVPKGIETREAAIHNLYYLLF